MFPSAADRRRFVTKQIKKNKTWGKPDHDRTKKAGISPAFLRGC